MNKVDVLYKDISGNIRDVAMGLSIKRFFCEVGMECEELFPRYFNTSNYDAIVMGGDNLICLGQDYFYDKLIVLYSYIPNSAEIPGRLTYIGYSSDPQPEPEDTEDEAQRYLGADYGAP